jgi:hypothetical protein
VKGTALNLYHSVKAKPTTRLFLSPSPQGKPSILGRIGKVSGILLTLLYVSLCATVLYETYYSNPSPPRLPVLGYDILCLTFPWWFFVAVLGSNLLDHIFFILLAMLLNAGLIYLAGTFIAQFWAAIVWSVVQDHSRDSIEV